MGARGPVPLSIVRGTGQNNNKGKDPAPVVKAPPGAPKPPAMVKGEALAEWRRVVPVLDELGILSSLDRGVLTAYCQSWARYVKLEQQLAKDGLTYVDDRGNIRKHPAAQMLRETQVQLREMGGALGLTPAARLRMPRAGEEGDGGGDSILD